MKQLKLPKQNIGESFKGIGFSNDCLDMTPKTQATKENIDKLDYVKN